MSFTSLCRFIPRHFILFHMIKNGIFLVFLSDGILLVYRKIIGFYISTLYPEPFLNPLMRSSSFLLTSLGFSHLVSHHLQTVTVSLLSLQFGVHPPLFLILYFLKLADFFTRRFPSPADLLQQKWVSSITECSKPE